MTRVMIISQGYCHVAWWSSEFVRPMELAWLRIAVRTSIDCGKIRIGSKFGDIILQQVRTNSSQPLPSKVMTYRTSLQSTLRRTDR